MPSIYNGRLPFVVSSLWAGWLLAGAAAALAGSIAVSPYRVSPVADGDALSQQVYQVVATEKGDGTGAKVWVYPLLWDSPDPPPASSLSEMFGTLVPGDYRFRMRFRALEAPTDLRVSWIPKPTNAGNQIQQSVDLSGLSASRWYEVEGSVRVGGPDAWVGRTTIALISETGSAAKRLTVWLDDLELEQLSDQPADTDGCDPDCYRAPLDFEGPKDRVGSDPPRLHHWVSKGVHVIAGVGDNMPWQRLPQWIEESRVHLATRLKARGCVTGAVAQNNTWPVTGETFLDAPIDFKNMGADVLTRHVKTADEGPWWPTEVPSSDPRFRPECVETAVPGEEDIVADMIARSHAAEMRQIAYYWMMSDEEIRANYPAVGAEDWRAEDADEMPIPASNRGLYVTQNSPYPAEVVEGRLRELTARGADGIKFDEAHNPGDGDWSLWSAADFAAAGFGAMPVEEDFGDPQYHHLLELYSSTIRDAFRRYHFAVHDENPETSLLVSANNLAALWEPQPVGAFVEEQQVAKGEWQQTWKRLRWFFARAMPVGVPEPEHGFHMPPRDVQSAFGFTLLRDSTNGRPSHIWVFRPAIHPCGPNPQTGIACDPVTGVDSLMSAWQLNVASGALSTYGNLANLDVLEPNISGGDDRYRSALSFGNADGPGSVLAGLRPQRWIGIHFNEHARQLIYSTPGLSRDEKHEKAWNEVLAPAVWAFATLQAHGVPAGLVTDEQLARGELYGYAPGDTNGYEVLFLPSDTLRSDTVHAVDAFELAGREVIRSASGNSGLPWVWHALPDGSGGWDTGPRDTAATQFLEELRLWPDGRVLDARVEVFFTEEEASAPGATPRPVAPHIAAYTDPAGSGRLVVAINNRWDWMLNLDETVAGCTSFEPEVDCLTPVERFAYVPPPIGKSNIYLRRGLVSGDYSFRYASMEDPAWKTLPSSHISAQSTANGERVILFLDGNNGNPSDDITFRSTLLIEAIPPTP